MEKSEHKSLTTSRGLGYGYFVSTPQGNISSKYPALLFLHGWPDNASVWDDLITNLDDVPFKIIAPDLLGYSSTAKPADTELYDFAKQSSDLEEILDQEDVKTAILIGHDWGSTFAAQFYLHKPHRVAGVVLLTLAYNPPDQQSPFDLEAFNKYTEEKTGYAQLAYWELFAADDGPRILGENLDRLYEALHGDTPGMMLRLCCKKDGLRNFLLDKTETVSLKTYAQKQYHKDNFQRFIKEGFEGPCQWYRAAKNNTHYKSNQTIPKENFVIKVPVLFVGSSDDSVCRPEFIDIPKEAGLLPDLEVKLVNSGHWPQMEKPEETAAHIKKFLTSRYI